MKETNVAVNFDAMSGKAAANALQKGKLKLRSAILTRVVREKIGSHEASLRCIFDEMAVVKYKPSAMHRYLEQEQLRLFHESQLLIEDTRMAIRHITYTINQSKQILKGRKKASACDRQMAKSA